MAVRPIEDLKTEITYRGQPWYDKPIYQMIAKVKQMDSEIAALFGRRLTDLFGIHHYERTPLKWVK